MTGNTRHSPLLGHLVWPQHILIFSFLLADFHLMFKS
ncbi:mCG140538 [Mus musculus]|nr:mCG140538 [Mus musculus]